MDRNFLLAFMLSILVIFAYTTMFPPSQTTKKPQEKKSEIVEEKETVQKPSAIKPVEEGSIAPSLPKVNSNVPRKTVNIESDLYSIELDSQDGTIRQYFLKLDGNPFNVQSARMISKDVKTIRDFLKNKEKLKNLIDREEEI